MEEDKGFEQEYNLFEEKFDSDGLFKEPNINDLKEVNYISSFDADGKPVIHQKIATRFEELHSEKYDKYLVPLFADDPIIGLLFRGNGVIVGSYLITAAHVAQSEDKSISYPKLYFNYEGNLKTVSDGKRLFDGRGCHLHSEYLDDIIIYELTDVHSEFELNDAPIEESLEMAAVWYNRDDDNCTTVHPHNYVCKVHSLEVRHANHAWKNCFTILNQWQIFNGNSGGAVFRNNKIYGILSRVNSVNTFKGAVIDAWYIQMKIDEFVLGKRR